jgi:2-methylcitrate dehydratase PrpD
MSDQAVNAVLEHAQSTRWETLPESTRHAARKFLADTLAVGVAGYLEPAAGRVRLTARSWGKGTQAQVLGARSRLPVTSAAFCNAFQIHCQEYDCLHEPATVHAMAVLGGALTALGPREQLSNQDALLATVIGVDVAAGLGLAATEGLAFFRPATAGALGSCVALARCLDFDERQMRDALGLVYSQLAGTMQAHVEGSVALPLQIAAAARAVVTALDLVRQGLGGPHDVFTGDYGYFSLFEPGGDSARFVAGLAESRRVLELSHKPFPTGRAAHAILDGIRQLRDRHDLVPDDVLSIEARVPPLIARLVGRPATRDMTRNYARLCIGFLGSVMLRDGHLDAGSFSGQVRNDADLLAAASKIRLTVDDNPDPNALSPQMLGIHTRHQGLLELSIPATLGSPENPLNRAQQLEKIHACLSAEGADAASSVHLAGLLLDMEDSGDFSQLLERLAVHHPTAAE